ncbi:MAG: NAD/NADP octopine/nopaline dehydrogenase family protein [Dethiobacteria bacterium]|jgi:opine dehydrogenase
MHKAIAVLGGGNGGRCMAADLTLRGHKVNFYEHPNFKDKIKEILETGIINLVGLDVSGAAKIHKVTTVMEEALENVDLINIVMPSFAHEIFFREMIPFLKDGQTVIVWAGDFGSISLVNLLKEKCPEKNVLVAETNTLPYGARITPEGWIDWHVFAPKILMATLPATNTDRVLEKAKNIWPRLIAADNVIAAALSNPNPICHPPGALLNTGRIQYSKGEFYMYKEGITEAVARVIKSVYEETLALAEALDCEIIHYEDHEFMTPSSIMGIALQAPFDTLTVHATRVKGPQSMEDRYITEDLPYGLVPMSELGKKLGVKTPIIDALINIGCVVCKSNFWETGRTLQKLGIDTLEKNELLKFIQG